MSGIVWRTAINIKLLVKVLLFFLSECVVRWTPEDLQKIQFFEPEQEDAGLAFNVQGNGTIARIMHSVLGGFSLQSKYCTKADSSVCITPFFTVGWWSTWVSLFTLTGLYVLTGLYQNKSDYFMCRLCDRLIYRIQQKRIEMKQQASFKRKWGKLGWRHQSCTELIYNFSFEFRPFQFSFQYLIQYYSGSQYLNSEWIFRVNWVT